jgi:hypothetical protein
LGLVKAAEAADLLLLEVKIYVDMVGDLDERDTAT